MYVYIYSVYEHDHFHILSPYYNMSKSLSCNIADNTTANPCLLHPRRLLHRASKEVRQILISSGYTFFMVHLGE